MKMKKRLLIVRLFLSLCLLLVLGLAARPAAAYTCPLPGEWAYQLEWSGTEWEIEVETNGPNGGFWYAYETDEWVGYIFTSDTKVVKLYDYTGAALAFPFGFKLCDDGDHSQLEDYYDQLIEWKNSM